MPQRAGDMGHGLVLAGSSLSGRLKYAAITSSRSCSLGWCSVGQTLVGLLGALVVRQPGDGARSK